MKKRLLALSRLYGSSSSEEEFWLKAAVEGGISQFCPASALQMHPDAMVFLDEEAASQLALKDFYKSQSANV